MSDSSSPLHRICVTPTRNENWIVQKFLAAASTWADRIIVADQLSTDGTREILNSAPGVEFILNDAPAYDESHRQRLLLARAREVAGHRILFGLDADEALSANCLMSPEWEKIASAAPGTILRFRWVNILPGFEKAWIPPEPRPFGFIDDGSAHSGQRIHSPRLPQPAGAPTLDFEDIVVLHFQYVAWERMASKQRWYQAWEYTRHGQKGPLDIFRQYNHMHGSWSPEEIHPIRPEWLAAYDRAGIDFRSLACEPVTWWDREIVDMLSQHGPRHFRRVAIWNHDWTDVAQRLGLPAARFRDPRSPFERTVHRLLATTQNRRAEWSVRGLEKILRLAGW
ncbi:MAG: glycosyltransferase family 2 protein [Verrucomicrobiota bacterium]